MNDSIVRNGGLHHLFVISFDFYSEDLLAHFMGTGLPGFFIALLPNGQIARL